MKNLRIAYTEYELEDGETITMSTAPILLYKLRKNNDRAYKKMSKVLIKGVNEDDVMEMYEFIYSTYINANQDEDGLMTFEQFIERANSDIIYNADICKRMISNPKKQNSEQPS